MTNDINIDSEEGKPPGTPSTRDVNDLAADARFSARCVSIFESRRHQSGPPGDGSIRKCETQQTYK